MRRYDLQTQDDDGDQVEGFMEECPTGEYVRFDEVAGRVALLETANRNANALIAAQADELQAVIAQLQADKASLVSLCGKMAAHYQMGYNPDCDAVVSEMRRVAARGPV